ncbi:SPFH domain-containing protein [Streptomyces sp. NRRL F-5135]|uniref:SPFH domain-containing protein n=1 Tax=Streptomyces sp. NRRL F-5135 TaxID=1463858 RepID=UPI000AACA7E9|nr:SPFH domain-containing protein [Streptomyces sp. NRRL F-5135]
MTTTAPQPGDETGTRPVPAPTDYAYAARGARPVRQVKRPAARPAPYGAARMVPDEAGGAGRDDREAADAAAGPGAAGPGAGPGSDSDSGHEGRPAGESGRQGGGDRTGPVPVPGPDRGGADRGGPAAGDAPEARDGFARNEAADAETAEPVPEPGPVSERGPVPEPVSGPEATGADTVALEGTPIAGGSAAKEARGPDGSRGSVPQPSSRPSARQYPSAGTDGPPPGGEKTARRGPLIVAGSTQEIPVHLLFRDDVPPGAGRRGDGAPGQGAESRGAQGRGVRGEGGLGGGDDREREAPRVQRAPAPAGASPRMASRPDSPRSTPPRPASPRPAAPRSGSARGVPVVDSGLAERPGPVLPGLLAVCAGVFVLLGCAAVLWWTGAVPGVVADALHLPARPYHGFGPAQWTVLGLGAVLLLLTFGGLARGEVGQAWVLTLFGGYRGSVRRTGLVWMSPLLLRHLVDVRLRHWRSEPMPAVDANGTALRVVVLVVWRVRDTVRAVLGVEDHEEYLREQVEAALARVLSQLPADAFHSDAATLRDAERLGAELSRILAAECKPVGIDVFSAQPTRIEYAPELAAVMQRRRIAAIDAEHRDSVLTSVVDAVDDTVGRLTSRGLVELDDYERKALVRDLTIAFYTGRQGAGEPV